MPKPPKRARRPRRDVRAPRARDAAAAYAGASRAENAKRAYTNDFVTFSAWCDEQGLPAMPALPGSVGLYLTALAVAEKKVATIERALVAISQAHKLHGFPSPRKAPDARKCSGASAGPLASLRTGRMRCSSIPCVPSSNPCDETIQATSEIEP